MKQCPTCHRTFEDAMRFCQTDGTPLFEISEADAEDPFKTTVGRREDLASAIPPDPFQTMVGGSFSKKDESDDILQLSEDQDSLKTMFISDEEKKREMSAGEPEKESIIEVPPLVGESSSSADKPSDFSYDSSPAPKYNDPGLSPPNFGDASSASPFDQKPIAEESNSSFVNSPFSPPSPAIPSPFSDEKPASFDPPTTPLPAYKETEPLNSEHNNPFSQSPFGQSSMPGNQPLQTTEWTPPPAPQSGWQNQEFGANTPFQPPAAGTAQNQTLAIVSLILGVIGITVCQLTAPAALVTGYMARKKAEQNPSEYGGSGLALAGMIIGAIGTLIMVLAIIYLIVVFGAIFSQNL